MLPKVLRVHRCTATPSSNTGQQILPKKFKNVRQTSHDIMGSSALTLACELTYASAAVCLVLQGSQTVDCAQDCTVDSITLSGNPHYSDVLHDGMAMCAGLLWCDVRRK